MMMMHHMVSISKYRGDKDSDIGVQHEVCGCVVIVGGWIVGER
jgi:hypothetical protein